MILAKLVRGEQRDVDYARVAVRAGLVHAAVLQTPYRRFARRCGGSQPREGHRARARCGLAFRSTRGTREVHQADRERGHLTRPSRPKVTYAGDFMARSARAWTRFWGSGSRSGTSRCRPATSLAAGTAQIAPNQPLRVQRSRLVHMTRGSSRALIGSICARPSLLRANEGSRGCAAVASSQLVRQLTLQRSCHRAQR
jgi:hypothetical protein